MLKPQAKPMIPSTPRIVVIALAICSYVSTFLSNNIEHQIVFISQSKKGEVKMILIICQAVEWIEEED